MGYIAAGEFSSFWDKKPSWKIANHRILIVNFFQSFSAHANYANIWIRAASRQIRANFSVAKYLQNEQYVVQCIQLGEIIQFEIKRKKSATIYRTLSHQVSRRACWMGCMSHITQVVGFVHMLDIAIRHVIRLDNCQDQIYGGLWFL